MKHIMKYLLIGILVLITAVACKPTEEKKVEESEPARKNDSNSGHQLSLGIRSFLQNNDLNLGVPVKKVILENWAKGKRERLIFDDGRNLLIYLDSKGEKALSVYEDIKGVQTLVWGKESTGNDYVKNEKKEASDGVPEYIVLETNKNGMGSFGDILIPSLSKEVTFDRIKEIALTIQTIEKLDFISVYSTKEAHKAQYSESYSKSNPDAKSGYLGGSNILTKEFEAPNR